MTIKTVATSVVDVSKLMSQFDSDLELIREMFDMFGEYYPDQLRQIREAASRKDGSTVREVGHRLKGAVSNFYCTNCFELAREIEEAGRDERLGGVSAQCAQLESELAKLSAAIEQLLQE